VPFLPGRSTLDLMKKFRQKLHNIIFEADSFSGRLFDIILIITVLLSVALVMVDSMQSVHQRWGQTIDIVEWTLTILFSIEILLRAIAVKNPLAYFLSFFGMVDILAILPTYMGFFFPGLGALLSFRVLRVLRVFRVLKLAKYLKETEGLLKALKASRRRIIVFLTAVLSVVVILGSLMYIVEPQSSGFTDIPTSVYWAIVTLTTVGYGDISPGSPLGQFIASVIMILGYSLIVVPTGLVSVEMSKSTPGKNMNQACPNCGKEGHEDDAAFCKYCGEELTPPEAQ
jgi:voltage-gated potassium channel